MQLSTTLLSSRQQSEIQQDLSDGVRSFRGWNNHTTLNNKHTGSLLDPTHNPQPACQSLRPCLPAPADVVLLKDMYVSQTCTVLLLVQAKAEHTQTSGCLMCLPCMRF